MVRFIAHQSFQFHDLQRRYARFVFEILLVEFENIAHAFTGETNARRIVHELIRVPVARVNIRLRFELFRYRTQKVVRLVALQFADLDTHQFEYFFKNGNLHDQFFGHRLSPRFIFRVHFVTEGRRVQIERNGEMGRFLIRDDTHHQFHKPEHAVCRQTVFRRKDRRCVERAVE